MNTATSHNVDPLDLAGTGRSRRQQSGDNGVNNLEAQKSAARCSMASSFVNDIHAHVECRTIMTSINTLGHAAGETAVACGGRKSHTQLESVLLSS